MEITFDATRIRLATFRLEGESQIWWDWVKVSKDPKTMRWGEFREIFVFVYPGQDCRIPPTRHGLYGHDNYGHRERDRGCTEHPRYDC